MDMYLKIMTIPDTLIARYYEMLTDLRQSEVDDLVRQIQDGTLHPNVAKNRLAWTITSDFHSPEAADKAEAFWKSQSSDGPSAIAESESVKKEDFGYSAASPAVRVDKLLVALGLSPSVTEAMRKLKEGAVQINDIVYTAPKYDVPSLPVSLPVRLGKRAKIADIA
jgi:tyrosyl-tRNA synthetase